VYIDRKTGSDPLRRRLRRLSAGERKEEARAFIRLFHRENGLPDSERRSREREVLRDLARDGFYRHTPDELAFGARVAWRNHAGCIGRLFWKTLDVLDCRAVTDPDEMAGQVFAHLRHAHGDGRIRSTISIFAPVEGETLPAYFENRQIAQYAGYVDGRRVVGDPLNVEFTRTAEALGWRPPEPRGRFDLLPLVIRTTSGQRRLYQLPAGLVREVEIVHPTLPGIGQLGLRWYAVPLVSDMILTIGGIDYPCAPFNGFYMATEIASRDLVDPFRYDLMEPVRQAIGADAADPLWKDQVLTELNRAVLHSFNMAGVSICDHHLASSQYIEFAQAEHAMGRIPSGDWSWIVPPQAAAACPTFHMEMRDLKDVPNYYRSRADGAELRVSRATEIRSRHAQRWERAVRRWRSWLRRNYD
jgi:nitric-oxide synthase